MLERVSLIAGSLMGNRDALVGNATSLSKLSDSTEAFAARLGAGVERDSPGEVQLVIAVTLLMFATWAFVPAFGALVLGVWLRRELGRSPLG